MTANDFMFSRLIFSVDTNLFEQENYRPTEDEVYRFFHPKPDYNLHCANCGKFISSYNDNPATCSVECENQLKERRTQELLSRLETVITNYKRTNYRVAPPNGKNKDE